MRSYDAFAIDGEARSASSTLGEAASGRRLHRLLHRSDRSSPRSDCGPGTPNPIALFARTGEAAPVQLNAPPPSQCHSPSPAPPPPPPAPIFDGISPDGTRAWFTTTQPLIDSDTDTTSDLYLAKLEDGQLDRTRPGLRRRSQPAHPTPGEGAGVQGVVRVSADGSHASFVATGVLTTEPNSASVDVRRPGRRQPLRLRRRKRPDQVRRPPLLGPRRIRLASPTRPVPRVRSNASLCRTSAHLGPTRAPESPVHPGRPLPPLHQLRPPRPRRHRRRPRRLSLRLPDRPARSASPSAATATTATATTMPSRPKSAQTATVARRRNQVAEDSRPLHLRRRLHRHLQDRRPARLPRHQRRRQPGLWTDRRSRPAATSTSGRKTATAPATKPAAASASSPTASIPRRPAAG